MTMGTLWMPSSGKGSKGKAPLWTLAESPSHLIHRAQQIAADLFVERIGDDELTPRQFAVLAALADKDGCSQSDLTAATGIDRSTLADLIARMVKRDLLLRRRAPDDARTNEVRLTVAGRKAYLAAAPGAIGADAQLLASLSREERGVFVDILMRIATGEAQKAIAIEVPEPPQKRRPTARVDDDKKSAKPKAASKDKKSAAKSEKKKKKKSKGRKS
jgi:MarR family transcriptional regulator, temperature-dependent positive regulator of motility